MVLVDCEPGVVIAPFGRAFALMDISFDRDGQTLGVGPGAVVPVRMDAALLAALNARAEQEHVSRSEAIREAVRAWTQVAFKHISPHSNTESAKTPASTPKSTTSMSPTWTTTILPASSGWASTRTGVSWSWLCCASTAETSYSYTP